MRPSRATLLRVPFLCLLLVARRSCEHQHARALAWPQLARSRGTKYPCDVSGSVGQAIHTGVATIRTNSHRIRTNSHRIRTGFARIRTDSHSRRTPSHLVRTPSHLVRTVAKFARSRTESQDSHCRRTQVARIRAGFAQNSYKIHQNSHIILTDSQRSHL